MYVGQRWDPLAGERINDGTETYASTWRRREPVSEQDMIPPPLKTTKQIANSDPRFAVPR
jgi:hypothetical protein